MTRCWPIGKLPNPRKASNCPVFSVNFESWGRISNPRCGILILLGYEGMLLPLRKQESRDSRPYSTSGFFPTAAAK